MRKLRYKRVFIFLTCVTAILWGLGTAINTLAFEKKKTASAQQMDKHYPSVAVQTYALTETKCRYSASRPILKIKKIDKDLDSYIHEEIKAYQKKWKASGKKKEAELTIGYKILHFSKQTITIAFDESIQLEGKRKTKYQFFTYDIPSRQRISIEDIFSAENAPLSILSEIAYEELRYRNKGDIPDNLFEAVAAPKAANFNSFAIQKNTLVFYMNTKKDGGHSISQPLIIEKELFGDILLTPYKKKKNNQDLVREIKGNYIVSKLPVSGENPPLSQKVIALTFDDGPHPVHTKTILDTLNIYNAHATFFVLGRQAQHYPDLLQQMIQQGNEIGNHSWSHPQLTRLDAKNIQSQIQSTQRLIKKAGLPEPIHIRPPYGAINDHVRDNINGMNVTLWDVDPEDWKSKNTDQIVLKVMNSAVDGKIILMHDIYGTSAQAAVEIIKQLNEKGYQMVTISELETIKEKRKQATKFPTL